MRRFGLLLLGLAAGLVAFELALQALALVVWWVQPRDHGVGDGTVILCVGDSNTHGVGASDHEHTYPALLEANLRATGESWRVVNGGWPGRNSRDVLHKLPAQLAEHRPRLVYVLVGTNDSWSLPEVVSAAELAEAASGPAEPGFPVVWRTGRFAALVWEWAIGRRAQKLTGSAATGPPFLGTWHDAELGAELTFEDGGRVLADGFELWWRLGDGEGELWLTVTAGAPELVRYAIGDGALLLEGGAWGRRVFAPGAAPAREGASANPFFGEVEHLDPSDPGFDAAFAAGCAAVEAAPVSAEAWRKLGGMKLEPEHWARLEAILRTAEANAPDASARAQLLRGMCLLPGKSSAERLQWVVQAAALDAMDGPVVEALKRLDPPPTAAEFAAAVRAATADPAVRDRLDPLYATAFDPGQGFARNLEANLRRLIETCRAAGAEPVLLDYPLRLPEVERVTKVLRNELGVGLIEVGALFEELLRTQAREELFVPDGHLNDAGYVILAERVARDVAVRVGG
ncbi:MAG: GDSL-type esterase/lipase family protein [Planctomycetota bacterium]